MVAQLYGASVYEWKLDKCNRSRFLLDVQKATILRGRSSKFRAFIIRNEPLSGEDLGFHFTGNFWPNDLTIASISKLFPSCLMTCMDSATFGKYSGYFSKSVIMLNTSDRGALIIHLAWRVMSSYKNYTKNFSFCKRLSAFLFDCPKSNLKKYKQYKFTNQK